MAKNVKNAKVAKVAKGANKVAKVAKVAKGSAKANNKANAAKVATKGKVANKVAKVAKPKVAHVPLDIPNNAKVKEIRLDTMRKGSKVYERFAKVRKGMTLGAILELDNGPSRYDMACAVQRDRMSFVTK